MQPRRDQRRVRKIATEAPGEARQVHGLNQEVQSMVGSREVMLTAAGASHNKIDTAILLPSFLQWRVVSCTRSSVLACSATQTGDEEVHMSSSHSQPEMFRLYRRHLNHADIHIKLRQDENTMADTWTPTHW